jgi:hypothetical protein
MSAELRARELRVSSFDVGTFAGDGRLMGVAFLVCCVTASGASKVDPLIALRYE